MARSTQHISNNSILKAPNESSIEQCKALPITRGTLEDGTPYIESYWTLDDTELYAIGTGHYLKLTILGTTHPPVKMEVSK